MKQDIRIIALDLDGTLLNSNKELTERNYRALEEAARRGIEPVLRAYQPPAASMEVFLKW